MSLKQTICRKEFRVIENHNIYDLSIYHPSFHVFNQLGHRDKQVIRQCIQTFSVVVNIVRSEQSIPRVLEIGAGLSTILFANILRFSGETIKTIDAVISEAIHINSRGVLSSQFSLSEFPNCTIEEGITISLKELETFYSSSSSTLLELPHDKLLSNLDLFLSLEMEDRKYQKITNILHSDCLSAALLREYLIKNHLFESELFQAYKNDADEFNFLKDNSAPPVLRKVLDAYSPNIIYLDSGEFSSNVEFNIIDESVKKGTILIVQDIFFPKSIKSFLIASAIMNSKKWRTLWVDRTTPQGMIICKKES